jgi:hypothetical protein
MQSPVDEWAAVDEAATAPPGLPSTSRDTPTGPPPGGTDDRSIDDLLAEFDRATAAPEQSADPPTVPVDDGIDALLREFDPAATADRKRIEELTGQVDSFRAAEFQRQEREAAEQWASELQSHVTRMNPNLDDSFVRDRLLVMAAENPALEQAWRFRNLTDADLAIAQKDFRALEALYYRAQQAPDDPRKAEALAAMERRGQELQLMLSARQLIRNTRNAILKRADLAKPSIDLAATADREMVYAAIRDGGSGRAPPPEPEVSLGQLSDSEYRKHLMEKYGIAGF